MNLDNFYVMHDRAIFIFRFGFAVEDFASLFLKKYLCYDFEKVKGEMREAFMKFFQNPPLEHRDLSTKMTIQISEIPEIGSVDKAVDLFLRFFEVFCDLSLEGGIRAIDDLYKKRDFLRLQFLFKDAPPPKDYDEKLRKILARPILDALAAGRDL